MYIPVIINLQDQMIITDKTLFKNGFLLYLCELMATHRLCLYGSQHICCKLPLAAVNDF